MGLERIQELLYTDERLGKAIFRLAGRGGNVIFEFAALAIAR